MQGGPQGGPRGGPQGGGPARIGEQRTCYNCRQLGHIAKFCPMPQQGGQGRGGGRGSAQGRGQQQHQQRAPQPYQQQQQFRIKAPPARQVNALVELPPDQVETVPEVQETPQLPPAMPRVYRIGADTAGGIAFYTSRVNRLCIHGSLDHALYVLHDDETW